MANLMRTGEHLLHFLELAGNTKNGTACLLQGIRCVFDVHMQGNNEAPLRIDAMSSFHLGSLAAYLEGITEHFPSTGDDCLFITVTN